MLKSKNKVLMFLILFLCTGLKDVLAQQFPNYTLYYMNKYSVNPAAAGANGNTNLSLIAREESIGFEGAPKTHSFSIDSRLTGKNNIFNKVFYGNKNSKQTSGNVGLGLFLYSDLNGPIDKTGVNATYSYHLNLNDAQLSFGISLVLFQLSIQKGEFITDDGQIDNDPLLMGGDESIWITDANFGVYYSTERYFLGYSSMQLFNSFAQFGANGQGKYKLTRLHNLIGGYNFELNRKFDLEPTTYIKLDEKLNMQANVGFRVLYNQKFWGGLYYKTMNTLSLHCGLNYDKYYIAYAFDYGINSLSAYSWGTHELVISVRFGNKSRFKWLNTF